MVWVEGNLETLDLSIFFKFFLEVSKLDVLWDVSDENVVGNELLLVVSEELLVKWKSTALLTVDLKVSHLLTGSLEVFVLIDLDDSREEWFRHVSLDLWLTDGEVGVGLEFLSDLDGTSLVLWKIVQVDEVLVFSDGWHFFFFYVSFVFVCVG